MIKKLPSTSFRGMAFSLIIILLPVLLIVYYIRTGWMFVRGGSGIGHWATRANHPVLFDVEIGFLIAIVFMSLLVWCYALLQAIRTHRNRLNGSDRQDRKRLP